MKEIAIYKLLYWTLWPAFAIFVFLASEGVRAQSPSSRILLTKHLFSHSTRKCAGLPALCTEKCAVFIFVLCPHTTTPFDLLP
jgi:hypothetical protein